MNELKEEREAIVEEFNKLYVEHCSDGEILDGMVDAKKVKKWLRTALLSHEEKVVARVRVEVLNDALQEIENARQEFNPARHHSDHEAIFDRCRNYVGYLITQYSDPSLTLPITDENV